MVIIGSVVIINVFGRVHMYQLIRTANHNE